MRKMKILRLYFRYRFLLLNLLFGGYIIWLQPYVLLRLDKAVNQDSPDFYLGGLLLGIQIVELIGLLMKRPLHAYWAERYPVTDQLNRFWSNINLVVLIFSPIMHLALSAIMAVFAIDISGISSVNQFSAVLMFCPVIVVFAVIAKESFFVVLILSMGRNALPSFPPPQTNIEAHLRRLIDPIPVPEISTWDVIRDLFGDLLLLMFSGLTYTACWEFLIRNSTINTRSGGAFFEYVGLSILFLLVFISTRIIYLMQEASIQQNRKTRLFSSLSFLFIWIIALATIPVN